MRLCEVMRSEMHARQPGLEAPLKCVDAVLAAATLPFQGHTRLARNERGLGVLIAKLFALL